MKMNSGLLVRTFIVILCILAVAVVIFDRGGQLSKSKNVAVTTRSSISGSSTSETTTNETEGYYQPSLEQKQAIKVAEEVALYYGGFPSHTGDIHIVADETLQHLTPLVSSTLLENIRSEWAAIDTWNVPYRAEKVGNSFFSADENNQVQVIVTIRLTPIDSTTSSVPLDVSYRVIVDKIDGSWQASGIQK